ncbi:MAG: hypothetical protein HY289_11450 [Planctomycetes bacterium]|nr:hypothetical protein [Planctomycetota bacterium]
MSSPQRRFEILVPQQFNDGSPVPDELVGETIGELRVRFGALSSETQIIRGIWEHSGQIYRDEFIRVFVDVEDTSENQQFFRDYKEQLKVRFQQIDVRVTTYLVEVY